jgi:nicotinate-nucleotide adenylyltransferase
MKTGILGGTFNPIHNSHLYVAEQFREQLRLDRVLLIPTNMPPHKSAAKLASPEDRLAMCRLAVQDHPAFAVCDYEATRPGQSYTYLTLAYLREQYPEDEFFFLMGADMFLTVQSWRLPEKIYALATLCAAARQPGETAALEAHRPLLEAAGATCRVLAIEPRPLSSTEIRQAVSAGRPIESMTPQPVAAYIRAQGLYRGSDSHA